MKINGFNLVDLTDDVIDAMLEDSTQNIQRFSEDLTCLHKLHDALMEEKERREREEEK